VFYGGAVVGSLYWENLVGIGAYSRIFENPDLDAVHELITDRQVDFLATSYPLKGNDSSSLKKPVPPATGTKHLADLLSNPDAIPPPWLQLVKSEQIQIGSQRFELRVYRPATNAKLITDD
jgi:hypothetical protein